MATEAINITVDDLYTSVINATAMNIPDGLELDKNQFLHILRYDVLPIIGKYKPTSTIQWINLMVAPWIFPDPAPDWISDVGVAMSNQAVSMASVIPSMFRQDHRTRLWWYDRPKLYTFMFGLLQVECIYRPSVVQDLTNNTYNIVNLDNAAMISLTKLMTGYWMRAIGMSRRQASFPDMGITFDSAELVQEGQRMIDEEMINLQGTQYWWKAVS